jgi:hypothetical protein
LRDAFEQRSLPRPIHNRKVNYRLLGHPKPNGEPYSGADWVWLSEKVIKAARWLGYIPWSWIEDQRNAAPELHLRTVHAPQPAVVSSPEAAILLPDADDLRPRADLPGFTGGQHPYHLVLVGEKSSLRDDIAALAERYLADWYYPTPYDMVDRPREWEKLLASVKLALLRRQMLTPAPRWDDDEFPSSFRYADEDDDGCGYSDTATNVEARHQRYLDRVARRSA